MSALALTRKVRLHEPAAIARVAERLVREAIAGKRPAGEASALVAALAVLHGMNSSETRIDR